MLSLKSYCVRFVDGHCNTMDLHSCYILTEFHEKYNTQVIKEKF